MNLQIISIKSLESEYSKDKIKKVEKLIFKGVEKDVYNITAPFVNAEKTYIAGRVESRNSELDSRVMFFVKNGDMWTLDSAAPVLNLQDPFVSFVDSHLIVGGVAVTEHLGEIIYRTVFYKGEDVYNLELLAQGPIGMKDIRICELTDGSIGVFTRPQGIVGGRGRIGFLKIPQLADLALLGDEDYYTAKLIRNDLLEDEWIGANAICPLSNGKLGVLGHVANFSENGEKNYYPVVFDFDLKENSFSEMRLIAKREDLPQGLSKRQDLKNVLFPGGIIRHSDHLATLYMGAGDAEAYMVTMEDPFLPFEEQVILAKNSLPQTAQ